MAEIKSARERALERAERIGQLSPQELQAQMETECRPIGKGLAERFLEHGHLAILIEGIGRYDGEKGPIVKKAALSTLLHSIQLEDDDMTKKALLGIVGLGNDKRIKETGEKIQAILIDYRQFKQKRYEEDGPMVEKSMRETLRRMGITGSAVGEINIQASATWKQALVEIQSESESRLGIEKNSLAKAIQ